MKLFCEITKRDDAERIVTGYASTEALDSQGEIIRRSAIEAALPDYLKFANIREMHQPSAVGVALKAYMDDKGLVLEAHVPDDNAWRKVMAGVYKGFSIGGNVTERDPIEKHVITGLRLMEISLVDRPANPEALINVFKAEGVDGQEGNAAADKLAEDAPVADDDTSKATAAADATADALTKAQADLQAAHDRLCGLGAICDHAEKAESAASLAKAATDLQKAHDDLANMTTERDEALTKAADAAKKADDLAGEVETLNKTIVTLKAEPAPDNIKLKTMDKAADITLGQDTPSAQADLEKRAETDPNAAFHLALTKPMAVMPIK